ncbi:MAG: hypothetical protein ACFFBH_15170 [Promethearchaeota archaeon]
MVDSSRAKEIIEKIRAFLTRERPHIKLFDERIKRIFQIAGWVMLAGCIIYWIYFMFFTVEYKAVLYTTYFTIILISFTCIFKLESVFFNSITCLPFFGFFNITIGLISQVTDWFSFILAPVLHGAITSFQIFLVLHPKVPVSKKYLLWGLLFYITFMVSYDSFYRFNYIIGLEEIIPTDFTKAYAFYALLLSVVFIYYYKKTFGLIVD